MVGAGLVGAGDTLESRRGFRLAGPAGIEQ
jgi:hypothetical protein